MFFSGFSRAWKWQGRSCLKVSRSCFAHLSVWFRVWSWTHAGDPDLHSRIMFYNPLAYFKSDSYCYFRCFNGAEDPSWFLLVSSGLQICEASERLVDLFVCIFVHQLFLCSRQTLVLFSYGFQMLVLYSCLFCYEVVQSYFLFVHSGDFSEWTDSSVVFELFRSFYSLNQTIFSVVFSLWIYGNFRYVLSSAIYTHMNWEDKYFHRVISSSVLSAAVLTASVEVRVVCGSHRAVGALEQNRSEPEIVRSLIQISMTGQCVVEI